MTKISFYRTIIIITIIFIFGANFSAYYVTKKMEEHSTYFIARETIKIKTIVAHNVLTSELKKIRENIVSIKGIVESGNTTDENGVSYKISLQRAKIKSLRIRSSIINEFTDINTKDQVELLRINYFYDKAVAIIEDSMLKESTAEVLPLVSITTLNDGETISNKEENSIIGTLEIPTSKQGYRSNTCVIDNIALVIKSITNKDLNKSLIYAKMGKQIGQLWYTGLYYIGPNGEGYFDPMRKGEYLKDIKNGNYVKRDRISGAIATGGGFKDQEGNIYKNTNEEAYDFEKAREVGIITYDGNTYGKLEMYLEGKMPVVMEVPMKTLYPNDKSGIWHAISIFAIDTKTKEIIYSNTLTGKVERMELTKILSTIDNRYLKYPFHIISIDESKKSSLLY